MHVIYSAVAFAVIAVIWDSAVLGMIFALILMGMVLYPAWPKRHQPLDPDDIW